MLASNPACCVTGVKNLTTDITVTKLPTIPKSSLIVLSPLSQAEKTLTTYNSMEVKSHTQVVFDNEGNFCSFLLRPLNCFSG